VTLVCYVLFTATAVAAGPAVPLSGLPVAYCLWRLRELSLAGTHTEQIDLVLSDMRLLAGGLTWAALWAWAASG
jgi:hypothetical protein